MTHSSGRIFLVGHVLCAFLVSRLTTVSLDLRKFWGFTYWRNHTTNMMLYLTLYSKGGIEARHCHFIAPKACHLECRIILPYVHQKVFTVPSYRCCKRGCGSGKDSNWTLPFKDSVFSLNFNAPQCEHCTLSVPTSVTLKNCVAGLWS